MSLVRLLARHREAGLTELECSTLARKLGGHMRMRSIAENQPFCTKNSCAAYI